MHYCYLYMIQGYHTIFGTYGFWLPNDPRGSWSKFVGSWELYRYGHATKTNDRRSLAAEKHNFQLRQKAKSALKYPPVCLNGQQARAVGKGFAFAAKRSGYVIHACAILPEHVHLVIQRHEQSIEQIVAHLKGRATRQLMSENIHPFQEQCRNSEKLPTPWARRCWKVFINNQKQMKHAINYVEQNPVKEGKRKQIWSFVSSVGQSHDG